MCTRTQSRPAPHLAVIAARPVVYRPGVGLVEAPADWRERMNARFAALAPGSEVAA